MPYANFSKAFAPVLKRHRLARGLSKNALAERAGLHQTHIGLLENASRNVTLNTAKAIADALDIPLSKMVAEAETLKFKDKSEQSGTSKKV
ncbi:MAG: helix-turn-helix domain-containing protein [Verrucomicrobiota bacterium]